MQKDPTRRNTRIGRRLREAVERTAAVHGKARPWGRLAHLTALPARYLRRAERRADHVLCHLLAVEE